VSNAATALLRARTIAALIPASALLLTGCGAGDDKVAAQVAAAEAAATRAVEAQHAAEAAAASARNFQSQPMMEEEPEPQPEDAPPSNEE